MKIYGKPKFVIIVLHAIIGKILKQENNGVPALKKITEFTECIEMIIVSMKPLCIRFMVLMVRFYLVYITMIS